MSGMPAWRSYKADLERKGYFQVGAPERCLRVPAHPSVMCKHTVDRDLCMMPYK